jgi:hypothetical protein
MATDSNFQGPASRRRALDPKPKHAMADAMKPILRQKGMNWNMFAEKLHRVESLSHLTRGERVARAHRLMTEKPEMFDQMLDDMKNK